MPNAISQIGRGQPLQAGRSISRRDYNATRAAVRGARGENGVRVELRREGMVISSTGTASGLNLAKFDFGWKSTSGQTVTIARGLVIGFLGTAWAAEQVVSVGGTEEDPHVILAEGSVASLSAATLAASVPLSEYAGHIGLRWSWPLYSVCLIRGRPRLLAIHHVGLINLKSWHGQI